mgnify:CR=1 FL=1
MNVTINCNIVTLSGFDGYGLLREVDARTLEQFSVLREEDGTFSLSFAMKKHNHSEFAGQIHRATRENKLGKKVDTNHGKPDTDPTPPGRGGGAKVVGFENITAIAA